eukprot:380507_1
MMAGLWKCPENDFVTGAIPKRLQKAWKKDYRKHKKLKARTELNPSEIFDSLCKSLIFVNVNDELSRSGFSTTTNYKHAMKDHCEVEFTTIIRATYNRNHLKLKISKHYDGTDMITTWDDHRFEHNILLLNSGRPVLFGIVLINLGIVLPNNVVHTIAVFLNPRRHVLDEIDDDDEGHTITLYSDNEEKQRLHKMQTSWSGYHLNIITRWLSLDHQNEVHVHRFLQYLFQWFVTEKAQQCSNSMAKLMS